MHIISSFNLVRRRALQKPVLLCVLVTVFVFLLARNYAKLHFYRDPTSKFFDPSRAYERRYSEVRRREADVFVNVSATKPFLRNSTRPPLLCVGMLTIARPSGDVYFRTSVGSLLAGLTLHERDSIYLIPFVGHTNASAHPAFAEQWLHNVADLVLTYNNSKFLSEEQYVHIQELEMERERTGIPDREKHMFDYTQVLKECENVGAKYVAVVEDDILALDGWFHRMRKGLQEVERRTKMKGQSGFFYLRLFYTEAQLGWNSEEWPLYLRWVSTVILLTALVNAIMFVFLHRTSLVHKHGRILFSASLLTVCLMAILFFISGRVSMLPLSEGVHEMARYGCCAQAIVYPRNKVPILTKWYEEQRIGFVDTLAEKLGDERPHEMGARWALTPSVVQHIGRKSSKGDAQWDGEVKYVNGKTGSETLWNFAFELNNPDVLREEHSLEAGLWEWQEPPLKSG
ncbi:hypothetical protein OIDMADRAFT_48987 [Oidiodendron maius Zn]|uniref:Uncharacterized protein n=1 Tax=Oidiodendron maius (strain Zn) TaxID=913774 RepID=A0A0C3HM16_OIDMZ|nr:hypothetical protein OIDMADRAFT_48987 [Oidiodendron maius Zn]